MTTTFDKREEGFEKQFAHDEELRFKAMARRNKMLGLWAAGVLGKSGPDAEAYAKEVVLADFEEAGDNDVLRLFVEMRNPDSGRIVDSIRSAFQVTPEVSLLPRGTIAKEFEAAVKAPRFVDKRG